MVKYHNDYMREVMKKVSNTDTTIIYEKTMETDPEVRFFIGVAPYKESFVIGTVNQILSGHLVPFVMGSALWYNMVQGQYGEDKILVHTKMVGKDLWCNADKDLEPSDKEFPFMMISALDYLYLQKRFKEIVKEYQENGGT